MGTARKASSSTSARFQERLPIAEPARQLESSRRSSTTASSQQGGTLHGLRHSLLSQGLPAREHHPGLERPRLPGPAGRRRIDRLHSTNNFPEFTGRVCPAPCEEACVLNINDDPVTIKLIEKQIVDGLRRGLGRARAARVQAGKRVAVVGRARRAWLPRSSWRAPGTMSRCSSAPTASAVCSLRHPGLQDGKAPHRPPPRADGGRGRGVSHRRQRRRRHHGGRAACAQFDASCWPAARRRPRDLPCRGRELEGVHLAMDFLTQQNTSASRATRRPTMQRFWPTGKHVVVLGGGDTGSDCVGTAHRQGAKSVHPRAARRPPAERDASTPWPLWPMMLPLVELARGGRDAGLRGDDPDPGWRERPRRPAAGGSPAPTAADPGRDGAISGRCRRLRSTSPPISSCSPWASCLRCERGLLQDLDVQLDARGNVAADRGATRRPSPASSPPAIAPRAVARRVGDFGRARGGAGGRYPSQRALAAPITRRPRLKPGN